MARTWAAARPPYRQVDVGTARLAGILLGPRWQIVKQARARHFPMSSIIRIDTLFFSRIYALWVRPGERPNTLLLAGENGGEVELMLPASSPQYRPAVDLIRLSRLVEGIEGDYPAGSGPAVLCEAFTAAARLVYPPRTAGPTSELVDARDAVTAVTAPLRPFLPADPGADLTCQVWAGLSLAWLAARRAQPGGQADVAALTRATQTLLSLAAAAEMTPSRVLWRRNLDEALAAAFAGGLTEPRTGP